MYNTLASTSTFYYCFNNYLPEYDKYDLRMNNFPQARLKTLQEKIKYTTFLSRGNIGIRRKNRKEPERK